MAQILATADAATNLLCTLGKVISGIIGDMKSDFERLERHVRSMDEFYQVHKDDPLYRDKGLQTALKTETNLLKDIDERLKILTKPQRWDIIKKQELTNFLKESEGNLQQSNQTMNNLLQHIGTGALIKIANQGQNDPDSTDMERSNASQSGVTMASGVSGNVQDSTNSDQTDNDNVTMDSVVSSEMRNQIAKKLGKSWKDVGRKLGLKEGDLQNIHADHHQSQKVKAEEVLNEWFTNADKPPYRVLANALMEAGRTDLKNFVEANFKKYHKS